MFGEESKVDRATAIYARVNKVLPWIYAEMSKTLPKKENRKFRKKIAFPPSSPNLKSAPKVFEHLLLKY